MPKVASINYVTKRITLSAETVDANLDTLDVYREVVALRKSTAAHRQYPPMIEAGGNVEKIAGVSYTLPYARLLNGCRIVPYNTSHSIKLVRDTFTDDGLAGRDCFDRTSLSASVAVDIDVDFPEIETRVVSVGGASVITGDIATVLAAIPSAGTNADAVVAKTLGARTLGAHIQAIAATQVGSTTGVGTSHMTFEDGPVTVEADVPLPGVAGDRTNVVITGV